MQALKSGPTVPSWVAASLISLVIGGVGGFYANSWGAKPVTAAPAGPGGPGGGGMMGGGPGGGMGGGPGGGGGGGAQAHPNAATLVRTVGALNTLEKARGKELEAEQRSKLAGLLKSLEGDQTLTEGQCEAKLTEVKALLNPEQQALLEEMTARPGGRGGGPGGGSGAGGGYPGGGAPGGGNSPGANGPGGAPVPTPIAGPGGGGGGMGGGGGTPDYERPFADGRGKERLEELLKLLGN